MLKQVPWNQIYAYLGAITTIVGLASFTEDLQTWQLFFQFIYMKVSLVDIFAQIFSAFGSGLNALVDLYQAIFYPVFRFIFSPFIFLVETFLNFSWNNRIYDVIFMSASSFSAWYRGQIVKKSKMREANEHLPEKPSYPKTERLHYGGGISSWLDSTWDKFENHGSYIQKKQNDEQTMEYNRQLRAYYREELNYYNEIVSEINRVASECNKAAMKSAAITFGILLFIWMVDIIYLSSGDSALN